MFFFIVLLVELIVGKLFGVKLYFGVMVFSKLIVFLWNEIFLRGIVVVFVGIVIELVLVILFMLWF